MQDAQDSGQAAQSAQAVDADISNIWETLDGMIDGFFAVVPLIAIALVVFVIFWIAARLVQTLIERIAGRNVDSGLATVLARLGYWVLLIIGLMVALTIMIPSMTPAGLISGLGIGGVAIGFAFQDIFQNLLAGILILLRQPFKVGDEITSGESPARWRPSRPAQPLSAPMMAFG